MPDNYGQPFASGAMLGGNGVGWAQTINTPDASRILALDEAVKNITTSTVYVYEMAEEVRQLADSLFGAIPQPGNPEKTGVNMPSGRVGGLQSSTQGLSAALTKLHAEVRRLRDL